MSERDKWPDDVRRVKDEMDFHAVTGNYGWVVLSMADGTPLNHVAYPSRTIAVANAKWDRDNYLYLEIQPDGMTYKEAAAVLEYARTLSKMGFRIPDPSFDFDGTMPARAADRRLMARQLVSGSPLDPRGYTNHPAVVPPPFRKAE